MRALAGALVLLILLGATTAVSAQTDDVASDDTQTVPVAVVHDGNVYTGAVIGFVHRLRYVVTVINTCRLRPGTPLKLSVYEMGANREEKPGTVATVLNHHPDTGLTFFVYVGGASPRIPKVRMADTFDSPLRAVFPAVNQQKNFYPKPVVVSIDTNDFGDLGPVLSGPREVLGGSPVFAGKRFAGLVADYEKNATQDCTHPWADKRFLLPVGHAMDVVSHFMGRSVLLNDRVDELGDRIKTLGDTLENLQQALESELRETALTPGTDVVRRKQAAEKLHERYAALKQFNRLLDLGERLAADREQDVWSKGVQMVTGLKLNDGVSSVVRQLILRSEVHELARLQFLFFYMNAANTTPCDDGALTWLQAEKARVVANESPLPERLKSMLRTFSRAGVCKEGGTVFNTVMPTRP